MRATEATTNIHGLRMLKFAEGDDRYADSLRLMTNPTNRDRSILVAIDGPQGGNRGSITLSREQARALADWLPYVLNEPDRQSWTPEAPSDSLLDIRDQRGMKVAFEVGEVIEDHGMRSSVSLEE